MFIHNLLYYWWIFMLFGGRNYEDIYFNFSFGRWAKHKNLCRWMVLNLCFFWAMQCYVGSFAIDRLALHMNGMMNVHFLMAEWLNEWISVWGVFSISCPTLVRPHRHQPASHQCGRSQSQQSFYLCMLYLVKCFQTHRILKARWLLRSST